MWNTKCASVHTEGAQIKGLCKHACVHGFTQYFLVYTSITKKLAFIFHPSGIRLPKNHLVKINWTCYEQCGKVLSALSISYVSLSACDHLYCRYAIPWPQTSLIPADWFACLMCPSSPDMLCTVGLCPFLARTLHLPILLWHTCRAEQVLLLLPGEPHLPTPVTVFTFF